MNNLEQNLYWHQSCEKDMTYILGARCSDGVVLIGDTKVTINGGTDSAYGEKITKPVSNIVMSAAGIGGFYKDFQNRIVVEVLETQKNKGKGSIELTTIQGFSVLVGKVLKDMDNYYAKERYLFLNKLRILCAMRINVLKPQLYMFNPLGFPDPITQYKAIGGGAPYGKLFLKHIWKPNMSMRQTAKLGLFIIKHIQDMELDNTVGYSKDFPPQVYYIWNVPNTNQFKNFPIKGLSNSQVDILIGEIDSEITNLDNLLKNFKL